MLYICCFNISFRSHGVGLTYFLSPGCSFNIFRIFGRRDQQVDVLPPPASEDIPQSENCTSWLLSCFQPGDSPNQAAAGMLPMFSWTLIKFKKHMYFVIFFRKSFFLIILQLMSNFSWTIEHIQIHYRFHCWMIQRLLVIRTPQQLKLAHHMCIVMTQL